MITEDDELAAAIDRLASRRPGITRARALKELARIGATVALPDDEDVRRTRVGELAGALTGCYPPNYLEELRDEWPQ